MAVKQMWILSLINKCKMICMTTMVLFSGKLMVQGNIKVQNSFHIHSQIPADI